MVGLCLYRLYHGPWTPVQPTSCVNTQRNCPEQNVLTPYYRRCPFPSHLLPFCDHLALAQDKICPPSSSPHSILAARFPYYTSTAEGRRRYAAWSQSSATPQAILVSIYQFSCKRIVPAVTNSTETSHA